MVKERVKCAYTVPMILLLVVVTIVIIDYVATTVDIISCELTGSSHGCGSVGKPLGTNLGLTYGTHLIVSVSLFNRIMVLGI